VLASGLNGPVQMIVGQDGALYVTEAAGKLLRIPLDASAPLRTVADGLALPEGVAQTPWGSFIVAESAARRLVEIAPDGTRRTVAENLPIGLAPGPGLPPPYVVTGVAVGRDGTIYMSADRNNSIYRIRPVR
jgi:glucose/arabinose dehydrogenase